MEKADRTLDPILLQVPMRRAYGNTILNVALRATLSVSAGCDQSSSCIARKSDAKPFHFLSGFLGAIALAAAGQVKSDTFTAIVIGSAREPVEVSKLTRSLTVFSPGQARKYLTELAEDMFSGTNNYFLPIEAIKAIVQKKAKAGGKWPRGREMLDAIEAVRENEFNHCRSDYGPVRYPRDYPAPPVDEIKRMIKRRFEPIISIFGG